MYIGICGPSGAGKDTFAELLAKERGMTHISGGDILREMLMSLGLEPKKTALGPFGEFIRDNFGLEPLFERVMLKAKDSNGVIITGIRSPDETKLIKRQGGRIIYIDADTEARYQRIVSRSREHDVVSFEDFKLLEYQENAGAKGTHQNLQVIRSLADIIIENNGSIDDLKQQLRAIK